MSKRMRALSALVVTGALVLAACGSGSDSSGSGSKNLSLVAFSVAKGPHDLLQADFAKTAKGKGVTWQSSYGASGDQSRAVLNGAKADVVHLSLEPDVTKLVDQGLVAKDWNAGANKGFLSDSVVVFVVRKGNPLHLETWDDLVKGKVGIITPNPGSSGSAKWNILAAYGQVLAQGGSQSDAKAYLTKFFQHVKALPDSGRDATTAFTGGTGDVLISYENEAIEAKQGGADIDYVVPDQTILIQNPAAVTAKAPQAAKDYLAFALSAAGQKDFATEGFRPVTSGVKVTVKGANDPSDPFPTPAKLFTIDQLFGGWAKATATFFDPDKGLVPDIQKQTGH